MPENEERQRKTRQHNTTASLLTRRKSQQAKLIFRHRHKKCGSLCFMTARGLWTSALLTVSEPKSYHVNVMPLVVVAVACMFRFPRASWLGSVVSGALGNGSMYMT